MPINKTFNKTKACEIELTPKLPSHIASLASPRNLINGNNMVKNNETQLRVTKLNGRVDNKSGRANDNSIQRVQTLTSNQSARALNTKYTMLSKLSHTNNINNIHQAPVFSI